MPRTADTTTKRPAVAQSAETAGDRLEKVALPAKLFLPSSETEFDATVTDLSPDDASLKAAGRFTVGAELVLYIEGFDRFSASILRASQDVLRVRFHCSQQKRERTAEKIAAYLQGSALEPTRLRRSTPSAISSARRFQRQNGTSVEFEVIDISLLGASLRTRCRPPIGEIIAIGSTEGRVARYLDGGIVIEFIRPHARDMSGPDPALA